MRDTFRTPADLPFYDAVEKSTQLLSNTTRELNLISKELRVINVKLKADEEAEYVCTDWRFAVMVLDRLCLVTFTLFTMLATVALLTTAPHVIVT